MASMLELDYGYKTKPSGVLNSIFLSTVNRASNTLVSVAKRSKADPQRWRVGDHVRFMVMLMTWVTVWALRVVMDYMPSSFTSSRYLLGGLSSVSSFLLPPPPSASSALVASESSRDIFRPGGIDGPSLKSLCRALTHIMTLLNDMPASSRKYLFAMALADKIMEENARDSHAEELLVVNRTALSSSFARTTGLLYRTLKGNRPADDDSSWQTRAIKALPMGSYVTSYIKGLKTCMKAAISLVDTAAVSWQRRRSLLPAGGGGVVLEELQGDLWAEKLAQELLWITNKLRDYGALDEAMLQWGFATGLASLSLTASPRIQGIIVRISGILVRDLGREELEISSNVKYRLLLLWLPLFCHANNGLAYPALSSWEKMEIQRAMEQAIPTLPVTEQEVILSNWLQDFAVSTADWPNLQLAYDRWCQLTRELV